MKGAKYRMESDDSSTSLTVFDVADGDQGLYRCELHNQHGRAETSANLTVNGQRDFLVVLVLYSDLVARYDFLLGSSCSTSSTATRDCIAVTSY